MIISVVTLLWRNEQFVSAFVESLAAARDRAGQAIELVAVVNGPDGDTAAGEMRRLTADALITTTFLPLASNTGFAGGANRGCDAATGPVMVVANLDLTFAENFFVALAEAIPNTDKAFFLAPGVFPADMEGGQSRELGALRRDFLHRPVAYRRVPAAMERVSAGNGCCLIFSRVAWAVRLATIGEFLPAAYHSYYEDVELFWWASRFPVPVWFAPEVRVRHHQGGSFAGRFRFVDRAPDLQASILANYRLTVFQHASNLSDVVGWVVGELGYLLRLLMSARSRGARVYAASWPVAVERAKRMRQARGGRLRPQRASTR